MANRGRDGTETRHRRDTDTFKGLGGHSGRIKTRISPKGATSGIALVARTGSSDRYVVDITPVNKIQHLRTTDNGVECLPDIAEEAKEYEQCLLITDNLQRY